jgi:hypothetical protein
MAKITVEAIRAAFLVFFHVLVDVPTRARDWLVFVEVNSTP